MNKNLELLKDIVDKDDEYGNKYISLIEKAILDQRLCDTKFSTAKYKYKKEKFFSKLKRDYIHCEVHHIIPRCCGGTDDCNNLVYLFCTEKFPEHVLAHEYLWKSTSLFTEFHNQLNASYFKMVHSRKLSSIKLTAEDASRLREEYGKWKSKILKGKYGKNKNANKIIYNGKLYPSSSSLTEIEIDGAKHDRHTILDWARYGEHGLKLASGIIYAKPEKKLPEHNGTKVLFKGKIYRSINSLKNIPLEDGVILKSWSGIYAAARYGEHGLSLKDQPIKSRPLRKKPKRNYNPLNNPRSIKISYNGIIYPSARSLEKIPMSDGRLHNKGTILSWARKKINNLKLA